MSAHEARDPTTLLERAGVALLLIAALVPRVRDLGATFDRELEGFQGSCFAAFAVNYERLGVGRYGGYPVFNVDLPSDPETTPYLYPNHPPPVPLLGWVSLRLFAPTGWSTAWREDRAPEGVEAPLRLPFLAFHVLGLLALWWAVRQGAGPRRALLALAIAAVLPVSILYATLVNYENPCLALLLFGVGFHARWLRTGARRALLAAAALFLLASAVTFTPLFFVPALALQTWARRGTRRALAEGALLACAVLLPLALHGAWVRAALPEVEAAGVWERARVLVGPLLDGSRPLPEWARRQWVRMWEFFSWPVLLAACAGLAIALARGARRLRAGAPAAKGELADAPVALPLFLGGLAVLLGFYAHTWDGATAHTGQTVFLLNLVPACAALAAVALDALAPALARLRAGIAPLVVAVGLIAMPAIARTNEVRRAWRAPGPRDDPALSETSPLPLPLAPLPRTVGREIAALLPAGAVGLYPRSLGFTPAAAFYAWRTLVPVDRETWGHALAVVEQYGLADAPRFLLLPRDDSGSAAEIAVLRAEAERRFELTGTSERWELWRTRP